MGQLPWGWQHCRGAPNSPKANQPGCRRGPTGIPVWGEHISSVPTGLSSGSVCVQSEQLHTAPPEPLQEAVSYQPETAWDQIPKSMGFLLLYKTC